MYATHVQQTIGKQGRKDIRDAHGCPEKAKAERQLVMLIEVRQIQNDLISCEPLIWDQSEEHSLRQE